MADIKVAAEECVALGHEARTLEPHPSRETTLGELKIWRALPIRGRRLVGPWCFLDRYGPFSFTDAKPMDVAPHPHIGLQTVTWLLEGEIIHHDSLGFEGLIRPGGVNVMTSGAAIAHAEETPRQNTGRLNGVQLWVALPEAVRNGAADFQHIAESPTTELHGGVVQVFAGEIAGAASAAKHFSPIVGADVAVHRGEQVTVPLKPGFEHAVLVLSGDVMLEDRPLAEHTLYYLGMQRSDFCVSSREGARVLLIGGEPFPEKILMWWNFVARTPEEIIAAREDWQRKQRFGDVRAYDGPRLDAPPLVKFSAPNPAS